MPVPPSAQLTPRGTRKRCTIERVSTPGGTARSPVEFLQQCTPADEARSARKQRLDRNRQAARYAATRAARGEKIKTTALDFERRILASVDREQPECSFDMEALDDMILMSQRSQLEDQRDAAVMLRDGDGSAEARIAAAVHLMVGRRAYHTWTPAAKERMPCQNCGRRFAVRMDGQVRKHHCLVE